MNLTKLVRKEIGRLFFGIKDIEGTLIQLGQSASQNHSDKLVAQQACEKLEKMLLPISRLLLYQAGAFTTSHTVFEMMASYVKHIQKANILLRVDGKTEVEGFVDHIKNQTGCSMETKWWEAIEKFYQEHSCFFILIQVDGRPKDEFYDFAYGLRSLSQERKIVPVIYCRNGCNGLGPFVETAVNLQTIL